MELTKNDYIEWARRDSWKTVEFAGLLIGFNPKRIIYQFTGVYEITSSHEIYDEVKNLLETINTWKNGRYCDEHPFWFLEKAILESFDIPQSLFEVVVEKFKKNIGKDRSLINQYPELANKANVQVKTLLDNIQEKYPGLTLEQLPEEIKTAIDTYYECWHELPFNMRRPVRENIQEFLTNKFSISGKDKADRIFTVSKPPIKGGPATGDKIFKPRSQR